MGLGRVRGYLHEVMESFRSYFPWHIEVALIQYGSLQEFSRTCSLSSYFGDKCGFYDKFKNEVDLVQLHSCCRSVISHLRLCKLTEELEEGELIARRAGVFGANYKNLTVCPFHRYTYGLQWKPGRFCSHPEHLKSSKAKAQHGLKSSYAFEMLKDNGVLLPVGTSKSVTGCQVSNVQIDTSKQKLKTHKLKGITNYNEVEVTEDGLILRKSYGIGKGYLISYNDIDSLASGKQKEHESGCVVIEPFTIPPVCKGKIKMAKNNTPEISNEAGIIPSIPSTSATDSISELFYCPEVGCVKKYATYKGLEDHVLCGKHSFHLENKSTYDKIKEQWAALCNDVVITCKSLSSLNDSVEKVLNAEPMGWALKKEKKSVRFTEKVKDYLSKKFMDGEKNGKKANPTEVSEEMKIMRDGNGKRVFLIEEWLNATQITSFFSRLASKGVLFQKSAKQEKIDDDDLVAALTALDEQDLMANLMD